MKANKKKEKTTFKSSISHPNTGGPPNIFPKHIEIEWEKCCSKRKTRKAKCNLEMHNPTNDDNEIPKCETNSIVGVAEALISLKPSKEQNTTSLTKKEKCNSRKLTPRKTRSMRRCRYPPRQCKSTNPNNYNK